MKKVVFDTVVFVRGLINPRSIWGKVIFEHFSKYRLFVSKQILIEILEVFQRPEVKIKFRSLKDRDINRILEILNQAEVVEVFYIPSFSRDPKDDKFLATAKAARVNFLVSEDKDLLELVEYEGIKIIDVKTFLKSLPR